jgi:hypothetical protein
MLRRLTYCHHVFMFLHVPRVVVFVTGVLASVVMRHVPPFGASSPLSLSLLTGARKSYDGSVNIRLSRHSPTRIFPRAALDGGK